MQGDEKKTRKGNEEIEEKQKYAIELYQVCTLAESTKFSFCFSPFSIHLNELIES